MASSKLRADALVVEVGLADSLARARALIMSGTVIATDPSGHEHRVDKAGERLVGGTALRLAGESRVFVSRAGQKLAPVLEALGVDVQGTVCADIGISTGGFTDCLLSRGATRVHGVDVAYGMVAWKIRTDPRVILHERTNARSLEAGALGEPIDLMVADVSFISLVTLLPALVAQMSDRGQMLLLVKPQFELPRGDVPEGVVKSPELRARAVDRVTACAVELSLEPRGEMDSPLPGRDGNIERFLLLARRGRST